MIANKEANNMKVNSPALSVPSLASTTCHSSPESYLEDDGSNNLSTSRTLFKNEIKEEVPPGRSWIESTSFLLIDSPSDNKSSRLRENGLDQDQKGIIDVSSTTSSETTAIPSWNLSMLSVSPLLSKSLILPLSKSQSNLTSDGTKSDSSTEKLEENDNDCAKQRDKASLIFEKTPDEKKSCNSTLNLNPIYLADIFVSLGQTACKRYQDYGQTEAGLESDSPTESAGECTVGGSLDKLPSMASSPLRKKCSDGRDGENQNIPTSGDEIWEYSLERQSIATKKDIQQDVSTTILSLQQAVKVQKQLNSLKEVEIVDNQTDLEILGEQLERVKKERDNQIDREKELVETISIQKQQLDKLTSVSVQGRITYEGYEAEWKSVSSDHLEERHNRIVELESDLEKKKRTNLGLQEEIDRLNNYRCRSQYTYQQECDTREGVDEINDKIINHLKNISERLETMENKEGEKSRLFIEQLNKNNEEIRKVRTALNLEHKNITFSISEDPDAIEVVPYGSKIEKNIDLENNSSWCCDLDFFPH